MKPAVNILKNQVNLSQEQIDFLDTHSIDFESGETVSAHAPAGEKASETDEHDEDAQLVRGKTTFADLLEWGLSEELIQTIIGGEIPNPLMLVHDYCTEHGIEFSTIKAELQAEVDELGE